MSFWNQLSLLQKFCATASLAACGMILTGSWVVVWIEDGIADNSAAALYIDNLIKVLEIYAPVSAEILETATELKEEFSRGQFHGRLLVAALTVGIIGSLLGIVYSGSRTIAQQHISMEERIAELSRVVAENGELRKRVDQANERAAETNVQFLRGIGADLHDGPLQLVGLALLKLDGLRDVITTENNEIPGKIGEVEAIRSVLTETMRDIRHISAGLSLPDIEKVSLEEALRMAARKHEQQTGTDVRWEVDRLDGHVPFPLKACLYRFAQEGLNNAYQHANGKGQALLAMGNGAKIEVKVVDEGPGLAGGNGHINGGGQGLTGLRDRIESLGGTFEVHSAAGKGTCLIARFDDSEMRS